MDTALQHRFFKLTPILIHTLVWCGLLCIPLLPDLWNNQVVDLPAGTERAIKVTIVLLVLLMFYASYAYLAPRFFFKKRYAAYLLGTLGVRVAALLVCMWLGTKLTFVDGSFTRSLLPLLAALFILFMLAGMAGTGSRMLVEWRKLKDERDALELERSKSELIALRARVDPHYLFNSLNTIYALAHRKDPRTEGAVLQLSTLMRYVLSASGKDRVMLEQEVEHLKAFMEFQRLRSGANVEAVLDTRGDRSGVMIDPLLLQPFVENAYKHGVSAHEPSPIRVELEVDRGRLRFGVLNKVHRERPPVASTGNGQSNVRRRLELKYPGKHILSIRAEEGQYSVDLTIDLT